MRYFYTLNFFMLPIEICFKEEISEELLEMLLAHLILCSLSVMHSSRLREVRERKWIRVDGMAKWFFIGMHIQMCVIVRLSLAA
jgi:hypothetical protein